MILSNSEIVAAINSKRIAIDGIAGLDPSEKPFNTSAVDLRLGSEISVPHMDAPVALDLRLPNIAPFLAKHSRGLSITDEQPFTLAPHKFILSNTHERVNFPIFDGQCYSARVEGKSSLARCGILVHFTAPTIHAGFNGTITLEIINLVPFNFLLYPRMYICQLIIEEVKGAPVNAPNQFSGQSRPAGVL
jgi:dCTP deaminase